MAEKPSFTLMVYWETAVTFFSLSSKVLKGIYALLLVLEPTEPEVSSSTPITLYCLAWDLYIDT